MTKEFDAEKEMFEAKRLTVKTNLEEYLRNYVIEDIKMIAELSEKVKTLSKKHHKATNKITEVVKENKTLKQTILLMEENQREKEKMWSKKNDLLEDMVYLLEDEITQQPDTRLLETERYTYKVQKEQIEKELKETQEDNLIYYDILSTLLNDPEQAIDIYMQGRRRGELDE